MLEHIKTLVNSGVFDKFTCMEQGCGSLLSEDQLENLFRADPIFLAKFKRLRN